MDMMQILYSALAAPYGIKLRVSDPSGFRQKLYQFRAAAGIEALSQLEFRLRPEPDEIWIVKKPEFRETQP